MEDIHPTQIEVKKSFVLTMVMIIFYVFRDNKKNSFVSWSVSNGINCRMTACLVKLFHNHI